MAKNPLLLAKSVIFDFEDTLFPKAEWLVPALMSATAERGFDPYLVEEQAYGYIREHGYPDAGLLNHILLSHGQSDSAQNISALHKAICRYKAPPCSMQLYPGAVEALKMLRNGLKLAVIADGSPKRQRANVLGLRLQQYIDHFIYSDEIAGARSRKPDPRPYRAALKQLSTRSSYTVFVGNNPYKDFATPRKLGMLTIRVLTGEYACYPVSKGLIVPDYTVTSVARLPELLTEETASPTGFRFNPSYQETYIIAQA